MSISNSTGMALFLNSDSSGAAPAGNLRGMANGVSAGPSESLFQQLISRMLAAQNLTAEASGEITGDGIQDRSGGDLLFQLLLAGGNLNGISLQNAVTGIDEQALKGQPGESSETDESGGAMDLMQAFLGGVVNTPVSVNETALPGGNGGASTAGSLPAVDFIKTAAADPEILNSRNGPADQAALEALTALNGGKAVSENGKPVLAAANAALQAEGAVQAAAVGENRKLSGGDGLTEAVKTGSVNGKAESQGAASGQEFRLSEGKAGSQTAATGSQAHAETFDTVTGPEQNIGSGDTAADRMEFHSQNTAATTGAAALNPLAQPAGAAESYSQISDEIMSRMGNPAEFKAQLGQKGPMEFKMQLEPKHLGQIDINLKLSDGKLMIDILAANSKTQALLMSQVDKLILSMGLQNVHVESIQVNQQTNSHSQDGSQSQGYTANSAMDFSQRRQQEQYQQEIFNGNKPAAAFSPQQDELHTGNLAGRIESSRYDSHRMNYTV